MADEAGISSRDHASGERGMNSPWRCLEEVYGLSGVAAEWQRHAGDDFAAFKTGFLQSAKRTAKSFPCPHKNGCTHEVRLRRTGYVGVCKDDDGTGCDDLVLTAEDVEVWELNFARLGRAIAGAFECEPIESPLLVPHTNQVASYGSAATAVLLTLPQNRDEFQQAITALVADSRQRFILIGPTNRFVDSRCKELLEKRDAEFFDLASHVNLMEDGKLEAVIPARELFARFLPDHASRRDGDARPSVPAARFVFRQAGSMCEVVFDGCPEFHVENTLGAKYLDYLLHHPNEVIRAFDLEAKIKPEKAAVRAENSVQTTVDARAKREARKELVVLKADLEAAEAEEDFPKVKRLREEIAKVRAVAGNDGLLDADTGEKARDNVRKAINKVVNKLRRGGKDEQAFGQHVAQFVPLGYELIYNQAEGNIWA